MLVFRAAEGLRIVGATATAAPVGSSPGSWVARGVLGLALSVSLRLAGEGKEWGKVVAGAALGGGCRVCARADRRTECG